MSWDEIRKAVNSDLSVPLNERIQYLGGIVPRGIKQNTVSKTITGASAQFSGTILNITGRGFISSASITGNSGISNANKISINIDNDKKHLTMSGNFSFKFDPSAVLSGIDLSENEISLSGSIITNECLQFEESLVVSAILQNGDAIGTTENVSVIYGLY